MFISEKIIPTLYFNPPKSNEIQKFHENIFSFILELKDLQLFDQIDWVGNGPPIPEPRCGFRGEKCISKLYSFG